MNSEKTIRKRKYRSVLWWRELVLSQAASGESVRSVCERAGIAPSSFYRWQRRFAGEVPQQQFAEVELSLVNECEVRCLSGRSVIVRGAVSSPVLASVISAADFVVGSQRLCAVDDLQVLSSRKSIGMLVFPR